MDRMIIMEITRKTICIVFILRWCESIFGLLSVFTFEDLLAILLTFFQIFLFQSTDSNIFRLESNKNLFGVSRIFREGCRILGYEPLTVLIVCCAAHPVTKKVGSLMFMRALRA